MSELALIIARVETHPVRNAETGVVTGYMLPVDEWRSIRAAIRRADRIGFCAASSLRCALEDA